MELSHDHRTLLLSLKSDRCIYPELSVLALKIIHTGKLVNFSNMCIQKGAVITDMSDV